MHERLLELLADALDRHGYATTRHAALEGRSGTVYTVPLLAEGEAGALIIDLQPDDPLPAAAVHDMADVLHDVGADAGLLCHLGACEPDAQADGISLWGLEHLIHFVGEALVCHAAGVPLQPLHLATPTPPGPAAESLSEVLPPAFQSIDLAALEQIPQDGLLGDMFEASAWVEDRPTAHNPSADAPTPYAPPAHAVPANPSVHGRQGAAPDWTAADPSGMVRIAGPDANDWETGVSSEPRPAAYAYPLLPVRVIPDEARMRARAHLVADSVQMVLQPVHLIDYECDLLVEGSLRYDTITGRVQVHGTDKHASEVDPLAVDPQGFTRLPELPRMSGHERTLRVSPERASERCTAHLLASHSRVVDIEVDEPDLGFSYTEKKKVEPRPDHVRLNPLGVFHRVLWRLVSDAGHVDVDALTGEVVEEVLRNPRHDTLVID